MMPRVLGAAAVLIVLRLVAHWVLEALNRGEVRRRRSAPPPAVLALQDDATRAKAAAYTLAKSHFSDASEAFDAVLLIAVLASGILPRLQMVIAGWGRPGAAWTGAAFIFIVLAGLAAIGLPWGAWEQFVLEERFGFNRTTGALWCLDRVKALMLTLVFGFPVLWLVLVLVKRAGPFWWVWAAALVFAVQLVILVVYPRVILPWFNKLTPLPSGELRSRLLALGERTGFRAGAIEVIDGSRRSAHSNAYFTGFGRFRRVVLFDTLIAQLAAEELEAVLAHEIGHYRLRHIPQRIILALVSLFIGFGALAWLARAPWFAAGFGFPPGAEAPALLLFALLAGTVTFWLTPLGAAWSRRHEYQADRFARQAVGSPAPLVGALRKLGEKNLSNLTPHPAFSAFYYSHPALVEREKALIRAD